MSRPFILAGTLLGLFAATLPVRADDCSSEVLEAVQKQSKQTGYRMETDVISSEGPLKVTMEYVIPGRMRQVAILAADPKPVETILVDGKAWTNEGAGWVPLTFQHAEQLIEQMQKSTKADPAAVGKFECMGTETVDGRQVRTYKSKPMLPAGMKQPDGKEIETTAENEAVRVVYVDTESGLPTRTTLNRQGALDKPIFKEIYTYPADLKIEPPPADKVVPR
ncbi:MAG: hypothetical protein ACT4N2_02245 [Hyphomicrobium sp.]